MQNKNSCYSKYYIELSIHTVDFYILGLHISIVSLDGFIKYIFSNISKYDLFQGFTLTAFLKSLD